MWQKLGNNAERQAIKPLKIVHSSVWGPINNTYVGGTKYFVTFIDDFSRKVWVYKMKFKGEWFERFKEFRAFVKMQSEHGIKGFQWMSGGTPLQKIIKVFFLWNTT